MTSATYTFAIILMLNCLAQATTFYFSRDAVCLKVGLAGCAQWKEVSLVSKSGWTYYCFSQRTYLHTPEGPRSMAELKVGDMVMGIDPTTGERGFSKLEAWLHHDPLAEGEFDIISTNASAQFEASEMHNLAYVGKDGKISYKFANQFLPGDHLIGFPVQGLRVTERRGGVRRKGLFSPYTTFRNYFVYQDAFAPASKQEKEPAMALAHSLSQVVNPQGKKTLTRVLLWASNFFEGAYQPEQKEIYTHPSVSHFSWLYGSSWREAHNFITYDHEFYSSSYSSSERRREKENAMVRSILASINLVLTTSQF